jgi:hypothetical protein
MDVCADQFLFSRNIQPAAACLGCCAVPYSHKSFHRPATPVSIRIPLLPEPNFSASDAIAQSLGEFTQEYFIARNIHPSGPRLSAQTSLHDQVPKPSASV